MHNPHLQMRIWSSTSRWTELARNSDGDELLFVHEGAASCSATTAISTYRDGDYIVIPRGTMWRLSPNAADAWR